jgi:hypothetical protein
VNKNYRLEELLEDLAKQSSMLKVLLEALEALTVKDNAVVEEVCNGEFEKKLARM